MRCRAGKLRFAVGDAQGVFPGEIVDDSIQGACALGQRLLCVDAGRGGPHGEGSAPGVDDLALGGDGAARLRVGVAPGFPGVGETHVVETDACVDVPGRDGVERKELCGGYLAAGRFGADVPRQLFARNAPCAAVAGCRSQLDFPAVVAQRKAVAAYGRHDAERIEVCQRGAFRGDRDAARGVFDDDRPVKFAVEVIGRDESADGDVLRYRDAALPVAERFEVGDRILRLRRTDREFGLRGPVASGRQRQQDRQRQQANACSRSHRAV